MNLQKNDQSNFCKPVRQMCFRQPKLPKSAEYTTFKDYLHEISEKFCPYIKPSSKKELLYFSHYILEQHAIPKEYVFYISLIHTEIFRRHRREMGSDTTGLLCDNVIFSAEGFAEGASLIEWTHWILKLMYTDIGIMFGKFWKGQVQYSRSGEKIPSPPYHFLSIRCKVENFDRRFFESKAEFLLPLHDTACDTGQNILSNIIPKENMNISDMISSIQYNDTSFAEIYQICEKMRKIKLLERALGWANNYLNPV